MRLRILLPLLLAGLANVIALAQSYQSSFSEVKFDRAKGPGSFHAGLQVDAASGAASMVMPFGPGIGQRGINFRPTFSMRLAPQLGISTPQEELLIPSAFGGPSMQLPIIVDNLYLRGWGSASLSPGTFDLPLDGGLNPAILMQGNYSLPGGGGGSVLGVVPAAMNEQAANNLIRRFGYNANNVVSNTAGISTRTGKPRLIQMGSTGHLILGLKTGSSGDTITDEVSDYVGFNANGSTSLWDFPRRLLVIQGDVAYEFSYVNHRYFEQTRSYMPIRDWLYSAHYMITKIMNRFGESVSFVYDSDGIGYTAAWSTSPSVTDPPVKIRLQVVSTATVSNYSLAGNGQPTLATQTNIKVTYQGISTPVSSYSMGFISIGGGGGGSTGDRKHDPVPGVAGPPSGAAAATSAFGQWSHDDNWDGNLTSVQPVFIVQDSTGERIDFTYGTGTLPATSTVRWGLQSITPSVLTQVKTSTRTVSLAWNYYSYKISYSPNAWGSYSSTVAPGRPAFAFGVTMVDDSDGQQNRRVVHYRTVPVASWVSGPPPQNYTTQETWTSYDFYDAIMLPDNRVEVHKFTPPYTANVFSSDDGNMQYLAYLKHVECEVRYYEANTDWQSDLSTAAGSGSSAYKVVMKDRFSLHTPGNSVGGYDKYATPYPTRTRTWDKDSQVLVVEETTDFDTANLGWTVSHKTSSVTATPDLTLEFRSLQSKGMSYQTYSAGHGGERKTIKNLESISTTLPEWFIGRVINEAPTSQQDNTLFLAGGVVLPMALPPTAKAFDPIFNTLSSVTIGATGGAQVTTILAPKGASGLQAAQLNSAILTGAGLDLSGKVGVTAYDYDSNGFLTSLTQKPVDSTSITVQQAQDELGRPNSQTDANGKVYSFTWDGVGRLSTIQPPDQEWMTGISYPDVKTAIVTRGAQVSEFRYNGFGELILERRKNAAGTWSFKLHGYDMGGRSTGETIWRTGRGDAQEGDWIKANLTVSAAIATLVPGADRCVQWGWDDDGNRVCTQTQPTTITTYVQTPAIYAGSSIQYDKRGRAILNLDANGIMVQTDYLGAANAPVAAAYSPTYVGPIRRVTVAPGTPQVQVTYYESDGLGRLVRVTDALGQRTEYRYDSADRILQVSQYYTQQLAQQRYWTYTPLGWLKSLTQPESGTTSYDDFTVTGKPKTTSYAGRVVRTTYDWMVRPRTVISDDGTVNQEFHYDTVPGGMGKIASSKDGGDTGVIQSFDYSGPSNRLYSLKTTAHGQDFTQAFTYDSYGNRNGGTTSHGVAWTQTYHGETGLPNELTYGSRSVASTPWISYDQVAWQVLQIAYGNGVTSTFGYDVDQSRIKSMAHLSTSGSPSAQWVYTYDPVGNLVREDDLLPGGTWDQYGYDKLNRLLSALIQSPTYGDQLQSFGYDTFGNRISATTQKVASWTNGTRGVGTAIPTATLVTTTEDLTFDPNSPDLLLHNQLPANTTTNHLTGRLYDAQGNLQNYWPKGDSTKQLSMIYDALGRVTSLGNSNLSTSETYAYTAEGLRTVIEVRQNGTLQKTKFNIYNDARQLDSQWELVPSMALTWKRDVVYLGNREAAEFDGPAATGMHVTQVDHLGSPRVVTGATGVLESKQKYLPFGELLEPGNVYKTSKGYTNHEQTDDSGLIYMQARFYLPGIGRFASPDPAMDQHMEITQSWNIYSYVRNNPITSIDPMGTDPVDPPGSPSAPPTPAASMEADGTSRFRAQTYQSESAEYMKSLMAGDFKGALGHLGRSWGLALTDPEWLATAALATAAPFMVEGPAVRAAHVDEMVANGVKFTEQNLVMTGKTPGGQVVFLETGNSGAGLQHIVERHGGNFAAKGIAESQIPSAVMNAVTRGQVVGTSGSGANLAPVFRVRIDGVTQYMRVGIGSNGFIVQANPVSTWKPIPIGSWVP